MPLEFLDENANENQTDFWDRVWDKVCPYVGIVSLIAGTHFADVFIQMGPDHHVGTQLLLSRGIIATIGIGFGVLCVIAGTKK